MNLIGQGLYTPNQAAAITKSSVREVSRWLFGYKNKGKALPPLWRSQYADTGEKVLGFRDLMELRIVKAFSDSGLPTRVIRAAIESSRVLFKTPYPFTTNRFLTDGKSIFYEAVSSDGELTDLVKRQLVFEHIIRPNLYAGILFDADGAALRWHPVKNSRVIVLDPEIAFGRPVLSRHGIPTDVIAQAMHVEGDNKTVAAEFDITPAEVNAAVKYESQLLAA
ncbi:DUF433 domain-containing protein [Bordetella tumulicola]|uniref:DUF433 domain-containing protein n=1 Tax=Bordetella tumulicola TaxID=1649133 RepID=UPI0039F07295